MQALVDHTGDAIIHHTLRRICT